MIISCTLNRVLKFTTDKMKRLNGNKFIQTCMCMGSSPVKKHI